MSAQSCDSFRPRPVNGHDRVARIVLTRKQGFGFELNRQLAERSGFRVAGRQFDVSPSLERSKIGSDIVAGAPDRVGGEHMLQTLLFTHDLMRSLRIRPQIGVGGLLLNFG